MPTSPVFETQRKMLPTITVLHITDASTENMKEIFVPFQLAKSVEIFKNIIESAKHDMRESIKHL